MIEGQVVESDFRVPQGSMEAMSDPWVTIPLYDIRTNAGMQGF